MFLKLQAQVNSISPHCFRQKIRQSHAATDSRDENLKAKLLAAAGESEEERYGKVEVMNSNWFTRGDF